MRLRSLTPMVHIILLVALCGVLYFPYLGAAPFFDKRGAQRGARRARHRPAGRMVVSVEKGDGHSIQTTTVSLERCPRVRGHWPAQRIYGPLSVGCICHFGCAPSLSFWTEALWRRDRSPRGSNPCYYDGLPEPSPERSRRHDSLFLPNGEPCAVLLAVSRVPHETDLVLRFLRDHRRQHVGKGATGSPAACPRYRSVSGPQKTMGPRRQICVPPRGAFNRASRSGLVCHCADAGRRRFCGSSTSTGEFGKVFGPFQVIAIPSITTFPIFFPKDCLGACSCLLFCGTPLRKAPSRTMTAYF